METLEDWKRRVRQAFGDGIPNGWLLGWDRIRFQKQMVTAAASHECVNATSFDYSRCNRYELKLLSTSERNYVLTVLISFVLDVFSLHWTEYSAGGRLGRVVPRAPTPELLALEQAVRTALENEAFDELPREWSDEPLPDIQLELTAPGEATLSKCLFDDYEGSPLSTP